jgi:ABC-type branched-subunit amino acid transport system substrate-binding protein
MKKLVASVLVLLLIFALAACGGTTSGGGTAGGTKQYSQGATDTQVLIANSAATSGAYAPVGVPFLAGIEAYLKWVNDAGGIDGRQVKFNHVDDEFDPAKGKAALAGFVEDDKVFAIVGHFGTPVVAATVEDLKSYGIPSVYFATGIGQLYAKGAQTNADGYNIFPVQPIYITEGSIMAAYAAGYFNAKKIGIIYTNDDAGENIHQGAVEQIEKLSGVSYIDQQVPAGTADVSAAVTAIKNANVDFVIVASIQATMPTIVKELAAQGVNKDCITTYVNVSGAMSEAVVNDITGKFDVYGLGWVDPGDPDLETYRANIADEYDANTYAMTGWIAGHFFCEGLRRIEGQDITWENYMKALESAPIENPFGGFIDYASGNRAGTQEMNLSKVVKSAVGWEPVAPMASIDSLLGQ